jgi:hypothetical protein
MSLKSVEQFIFIIKKRRVLAIVVYVYFKVTSLETHMRLEKRSQHKFRLVFQQYSRNMLVSARGESSDLIAWDCPFPSSPHELAIRRAGFPLITGTDAAQLVLQ